MKPLYSPEDLALEKHLFETPDHHAYAIVDGAAVPALLSMITGYSSDYRCLFQGDLTPQLTASAPYLIKLESFTNVTEWLMSAKGTHQQIFALLPDALDFEAVYKHFRRFLRIRGSNNQMLYFRFYDPRVLTRFLPSCTPEQLQTIFGPVNAYLAEDSATDVLCYWVENQQIKHEPLLSKQISSTPQNTDTNQGSAVC